jgi:methylated-DNA-[protein]-cysteine S-methyltransferase
MTNIYTTCYPSPIGVLQITGTTDSIKTVDFAEVESHFDPTNLPPVIAACLSQLDEYFRGERQTFALKLKPEGTAFQQRVWQQLTTIPYGQTVSYMDIARLIGNEKTIRAVGAANGQNPIVIIIPCHRVVGSNGKLVGYGGGVWRKEWLLNHERKFGEGQLPLF